MAAISGIRNHEFGDLWQQTYRHPYNNNNNVRTFHDPFPLRGTFQRETVKYKKRAIQRITKKYKYKTAS